MPHFREPDAAPDDPMDGDPGVGTPGSVAEGPGPSHPLSPAEPKPLRKNRSYQLLWLGSTSSALGTGASSIAFPLLILGMTGSAALAGVSAAASTAAMVVAGLPAGALADRWDRRRALILVETVRAVNGLVLVVAILGHWISLAHIIIAAIVQGAGGALLMPCRNAAIRDVVHRDQLHAAFGQEEARSHVADIGGPPLGAAAYGIGRFLPFLIDALSYLVSLVCIVAAHVPRGTRRATEVPPTSLRADIREGLAYVWRDRSVRALIAVLPLFNIAGAGISLLLVVLLQSRGFGPGTIGAVMAIQGGAGVAGALVAGRISRWTSPGRLVIIVLWVSAIALGLIAVDSGPWWTAGLCATAVFLVPAVSVAAITEITGSVDPQILGRVLATLGVVAGLASPLGPLAAGIAAQWLSPSAAVLLFSAYLALVAFGASLSQGLRSAGRGADTAPAPVRG